MLQAAAEGDGNAPSSPGAAGTDTAADFGAQMRAAAQARRQELRGAPKQARPVIQASPDRFVGLSAQRARRTWMKCAPVSSDHRAVSVRPDLYASGSEPATDL